MLPIKLSISNVPISNVPIGSSNFPLDEIGYEFISPVSGTFIDNTATDDDATAPEPATLAVLGLGLAGLGLVRRRRRK